VLDPCTGKQGVFGGRGARASSERVDSGQNAREPDLSTYDAVRTLDGANRSGIPSSLSMPKERSMPPER